MKKSTKKQIMNRASRCILTSLASLILDLSLLYLLIEKADFRYLIATGIAFWTAHTIHYVADREWIFSETKAEKYTAYFNFLIVGLIGSVLILTFVKIGVEIFGWGYIPSRLSAALIGGTAIFAMNYIHTFKMGSELKRFLKESVKK